MGSLWSADNRGKVIFRERLNMDVVFVSQFRNDRRTFKVAHADLRKTLVVAGAVGTLATELVRLNGYLTTVSLTNPPETP